MIDKQTPHQIGDIVYYAHGDTGAITEAKVRSINYNLVKTKHAGMTAVALSYVLSDGRIAPIDKLYITIEDLVEHELKH